ncbi:MAG TPA: ORC1-type DNA replication protein [Methanoregulaceae archaeon]|nr:ORC1-type DNA replication protein [Methanoregulaceae archaeon]
MTRHLLNWDETLFRDSEVFDPDFVPEQFNFREAQMRELAFQLRPGLRGARPLNTVCRGPPGTGKTTTVRKLFAEVEEASKALVPIYVNCQLDNTTFGIISEVYNRLTGHLPRSSGTSTKKVFDAVARLLEHDDRILVVALDDANYLLFNNELNRVLYMLLRTHEVHPGTKIAVIVILSDLSVNLPERLDARVQSIFRPGEVYFSPYMADEVRSILDERARQGFYPGVLPGEELDLVVDQTMKSGDLRVGIDLLKRAGIAAEMDGRRRIEEGDVCRAYTASRYLHLDAVIRTLRDEERAVLEGLARASAESDEITSGDLFERIRGECGIKYTRFWEIITKFETMHLADIHYRTGRGRTRTVSLRYEPERILERLK